MKAIQVTKFVESFDDLEVVNVSEAVARNDEVIVNIKATGLNFVDLLYARGKHQNNRSLVTPPFILGTEFSGIVSQASPQSKFSIGDRVFGHAQGSFAERIAVPENAVYSIPKSWSFEDAAGLAATAPVSYGALITRAEMKKGDRVLVHAGAGGLGLMAVQIAKAVGATVIATAGSKRKMEIVKTFGADVAIDYNTEGWWKEVLDATEGKGVNIVYDSVGKVSESLKCCAPLAKILIIGFAGTEGNIEKIAMNRVLLRQVQIIGYRHGESARLHVPGQENIIRDFLAMVEEGKIKPTNYDTKYLGLKSTVSAMHDLAARKVWGKAVITLDDSIRKAKL